MKKIMITLIVCMLVGCSTQHTVETKDGKLSVVTTSFIGYDIAVQISKDKANVINVLPLGSELHNFEPSAKDIINIKEADLFIYLSETLEPWLKNISKYNTGINLSKSYSLKKHKHEFGERNAEEHDHASLHFWSDPTTYIQLIEKTKDQFVELDPDNQTYYEQNATAYCEEIKMLHTRFAAYIKKQDHPSIYYAAHNAMEAFANRYHIRIKAFDDEYRPDADITAQQIKTMKDEIEQQDIHYLFVEELQEPRVAKQIQAALQEEDYTLEIMELHSYHNISKEQNEKGIRYADILQANITNIKQALDH
ncbi:MAG: metal ABC transporter substrate-binding protein [Breznakia sp.]